MGENKKRPLEWRTRLASNQPKPPATVLNNNDDVIAILRRDRATMAIRDQLSRTLESSLFIQSDKLGRFLRFTVETTLDG
jgi:hypothetical protein